MKTLFLILILAAFGVSADPAPLPELHSHEEYVTEAGILKWVAGIAAANIVALFGGLFWLGGKFEAFSAIAARAQEHSGRIEVVEDKVLALETGQKFIIRSVERLLEISGDAREG